MYDDNPIEKAMLGHALLSRAEQDALLARYRELADRHGADSRHAVAARNAVVAANMRLVAHVAKRFKRMPTGVEHSDLMAWGALGLMDAVARFDPSRGNAFSTYATWWIRHHIGRALADTGSTIRVPVHAQETVRRQFAESEDAKTTKTIADARAARALVSLNAPVVSGDDASQQLGDVIADERATALDRLEHAQDVERVAAAVARLPERLQHVVRARSEGSTLREVGLGLDDVRSRERVRTLEAEAFAMLRRALRTA